MVTTVHTSNTGKIITVITIIHTFHRANKYAVTLKRSINQSINQFFADIIHDAQL